MLTPGDSFEVNGAQADFILAPVAEGRWAIAEWTDPVPPVPLAVGSRISAAGLALTCLPRGG
jgi:hypothetical protein